MRPAEKTVWRVRVGLAGLVILLGVGLLVLVVRHVPTPGGMGLPLEERIGLIGQATLDARIQEVLRGAVSPREGRSGQYQRVQ